MTQATKKKKVFVSFQVGDEVKVRLAGRMFPALVIEDRGDLGPGGSHLLRVEILPKKAEPDREPEQFEVPAEALVPA